jgi:hypothetical protein
MSKNHVLLTAIAVLAVASFANATITQIICHDDGDQGIVMAPVNILNPNPVEYETVEGVQVPVYNLNMSGVQNDAPAHMKGDFITSASGDPIVWIMEDVDNQTGFTWTGYQFYVYMDKTFSITGVTAPLGWTYTVSQPVDGQTLPHGWGTGWRGLVSYTAGTGYEIANGNTTAGTFGVKVKFDGTVAFCTEQIPTPEPATMAILGLGGMALLRRRVK